jgi:hypothetical protein
MKRNADRNALVLFKACIGMDSKKRIIFCIAILVLLLPVAALGLVSEGKTIEGSLAVTYSPNRPVVGEPLTLRISVGNTGDSTATYRLCYQEPGASCKWYTFTLSPDYSQKYNIVYKPKAIGDTTFDFSLYWYKDNLQTVPLQNLTKTIIIYSAQNVSPTTSAITTQVASTTTNPPVTTEVIGFDFGIALITLCILVMLKKR